ncbi:MAG: 8-oxo-dGTP pyrophosphatase MutT (NUDIX family) [Bradymonadia bacterium]
MLVPMWEAEGRVVMALTLRSQELSSHSGQISFPGGRRDAGELDLRATALRETHEELGIHPNDVSVVAQLDDAWSIQRYVVSVFVGWLPAPPIITPSPAEIDRVIYADVEQMMRPAAHACQRMRRGGQTFAVHSFDVDGDSVWGLTGGVLYGLFRRLRGEAIDADTHGPTTFRRFIEVQ